MHLSEGAIFTPSRSTYLKYKSPANIGLNPINQDVFEDFM